MQILGVNGWRYSTERFLKAIDESKTRHKIELVVADGERIRNLVLEYSEGPKYLELVRDPARPDVLGEILKPRAAAAQALATGLRRTRLLKSDSSC